MNVYTNTTANNNLSNVRAQKEDTVILGIKDYQIVTNAALLHNSTRFAASSDPSGTHPGQSLPLTVFEASAVDIRYTILRDYIGIGQFLDYTVIVKSNHDSYISFA